MPESRNAEAFFVLTSLNDIVMLGNGYISVSGQAIFLVSVNDVDGRTVFRVSQKGELRDTSLRSLRDVIDCGVGWLQKVISEIR